ncbi:MAG: hypothetical protein ACYDC5_01195 [Candidatus Dormibacteria bacterium]
MAADALRAMAPSERAERPLGFSPRNSRVRSSVSILIRLGFICDLLSNL